MVRLTHSLKMKFLPQLIQRDSFKCFYCKQIMGKKYYFDHLDNNPDHSVVENIVLCHQNCNVKKVTYIDYQIMAKDKLKQNEEELFVREKNTHFDYTSEIGINVKTYEMTESFLNNEIDTKGYALFKDTLNSIVFLCKKKFGHGSVQSVRNHLDVLTTSVAPYEITKNDANQKIITRKENQ